MYIFCKEAINNISEVYMTHYRPEELTPERLEQGIEVKEVPELDISKKHMAATLFYNTKTKELFYEYNPRTLTAEEQLRVEMEELKEQMATLMMAIKK